MQDFYRWEDGTLPEATMVANTTCYKLVADMLYEARVQAIMDYKARIEKVKVKKPAARDIRLTREQYVHVSVQHY